MNIQAQRPMIAAIWLRTSAPMPTPAAAHSAAAAPSGQQLQVVTAGELVVDPAHGATDGGGSGHRPSASRPKTTPANPLMASLAAITGPRPGVTRNVGRIVP
jgi:hypothetical protein